MYIFDKNFTYTIKIKNKTFIMSNLTKEEKINKFIEFMKVSEVSAYEVSKTTKVTEAAIGRI